MGRAMAEVFPVARDVFNTADAALAGDARALSKLCFEGPIEELTLTANTQPAIVATSIACLAALRARLPSLEAAMMSGHSLGEYSALVASGALDLADTIRLVRLRGQAMQESVPSGEGAMAAIMGLDAAAVEAVCEQTRVAMPGRTVSAANFNAPGQVVIAGHADAVAAASASVAERKGKAIALKVSAPFHCALMRPAAARLALALEPVGIAPLGCPVVANFTGEANLDPARVPALLVDQVAGTVRWDQCVRTMVAAGIETFVEIGPGKVLAGLIRRIHKPAVVHNVSDPASLEVVVAALGG